jgi:hypothetical protein
MEPADKRPIDEHEYELRGSLRSIRNEYGSDLRRWIDWYREQFAARDHRQIDHGERSQPRPETRGRTKYRPGAPIRADMLVRITRHASRRIPSRALSASRYLGYAASASDRRSS